jgi:phosphoglycerate dehydrogenase-like enzyme
VLPGSEAVRVLICSMLEPEYVERIAAVDSRIEVLYEPDLLPVPKYRADHNGSPRQLSTSDAARWSSLLATADVTYDFDWRAPELMPTQCPRLKWVQATSAGIGEFLRQTELELSDIQFTTAAGVHATPLAEFAVMGALYFIKGLPALTKAKAQRSWQRYTTRQLAGRRVAVVGLGRVGSRVAQSFAVLGSEVWGLGRMGGTYDTDGSYRVIELTELDELLPTVDVIVLCCPLTAETRDLLDARRLELLPDHAIVINLARGDVITEDALISALAGRTIGGACLDVFSTEPLPADSPLWDMDNVIVSPHSASTVEAENGLITDLFCSNLRNWLSGEQLTNVYQRARGY